MSRKTPPARFRLRTEDGSEVPVSTVEALARRVSRGDVLPDTPLFDAGPGSWGRAADSTVVRFILDQLKEEGKEIPLEWAAPLGPPLGADAASSEASPAPAPVEPPADSPLGFDLTLADVPDQSAPRAEPESFSPPPAPEAPSSFDLGPLELAPMELAPMEPEPPQPPESEPPESRISFEPSPADSAGDKRSIAPTSSGGLLADDLPSAAEAWKPPKPSSREPDRSDDDVVEESDEAVVIPRRSAAAREAVAAPVAAGGRASGSRAWIGIVVLVVGVVGGAGWFFLLRSPSGEGSGSASTASFGAPPANVSGRPAPPSPPAGSEAAAEAALARYATRMDATIDSLRIAHSTVIVPSREWLSGNYLANASAFAGVREFWVGYRALVVALRARDRPLLQEIMAEGRAPGETPGNSTLERYLTLRYESATAGRQARYDQLLAVADEAIRFHDFLLANESSLRYTPALGASIPQDPVLEMQASTPELRTDLFARLDGLLQALDRSRGGAEAPPGGLTVDLFAGFGAI